MYKCQAGKKPLFSQDSEVSEEFPFWLSSFRTQLVSIRMRVQFLASLCGLKIWHCCKLQCRSQMRLGSGVAMAGGYGSNSTLSLRTSICHRCHPKKKKKKIVWPQNAQKIHQLPFSSTILSISYI